MVCVCVCVCSECVWSQEEPENMGPWPFVEPRFRKQLGVQVRETPAHPPSSPSFSLSLSLSAVEVCGAQGLSLSGHRCAQGPPGGGEAAAARHLLPPVTLQPLQPISQRHHSHLVNRLHVFIYFHDKLYTIIDESENMTKIVEL